MHRSIQVVVALILLAGFGPPPVFGQRNKLDHELRRLASTTSGTGTVNVLVTTKPNSLLAVARTIRRRGDLVKTAHRAIDALAVEVGRDRLAALAADPLVDNVSIDALVSAVGAPKLPSDKRNSVGTRQDSEDGGTLDSLNVLRATLGLTGVTYTGAGIGVAIVDSGIQPLADFDNRIAAFRDFTRDDSPVGVSVRAYDDYGHGTHIAGLIGSNGGSSSGEFRGVAPLVRLIGLKVLDEQGHGTTSDVISAIEFAIANRRSLGIDVLNLSLGHPIYERAATDPLVRAVEKATRAGIIVVAAAGNFGRNPQTGEVGYAGIMSPGNAPSAITVGAMATNGTADRRDDRIPDYSSRGPTWYDGFLKPDVVAPGHNLASNVPRASRLAKSYPQLVTKSARGVFITLSGTSMSAAVTTGVVALTLEAQRWAALTPFEDDRLSSTRRMAPVLPANAVKALLQYSAIELTTGDAPHDALTQGAGGVNAEGAIRLASALDVAAPFGTEWISGFGDRSSTIAGQPLPWGQTVYWGGYEVLGPSLLVSELAWTGHIVWGTNTFWTTLEDLEHIVWGTMIDWSFTDEHIVWGTGLPFQLSFLDDEHIVWGSNLFWDEHIVWGTSLGGLFWDEHIVWGSADGPDSTYWGNLLDLEYIVWGTNALAAEGSK